MKYLVAAKTALTREMIYPLSFAARMVRFPLMLTVVASIWRAAPNSSTAEYSLHGIFIYYALVSFLRICESDFSFGLPYRISTDIQSGNLSVFLIKPISYPLYMLALDVGRITVHVGTGIPLIIALSALQGIFIKLNQLVWFALSCVLGLTISAMIGLLIGMISFWTGRVFGIRDAVHSLSFILSGALIPLGYLPGWFQYAAGVLPFRQGYHAPISVFMGSAAAPIVFRQALWLGFLLLLVLGVWTLGLRRFEAQGG